MSITCFLWYNAIVYHLIALKGDIFAPSWIPPGILNIKVMLAALAIIIICMDKKFIMTIINFKWTLKMSSINKVQNRWYLYLKTSFSSSLCFVEPNTGLWMLLDNVWRCLKRVCSAKYRLLHLIFKKCMILTDILLRL